MRDGAYHYLCKPPDMDQLVATARVALEATSLRREVRGLRAGAAGYVDAIVGESPAIMEVKRLVARIATSPGSTVLVTGESGTGKDVVARTIHQLSGRRECRFVNITCSALPEPLLESELFGHERGAFTDARQQKLGLLERADGGTVFLDEIGEMSPSLQSKLLRFLEDKTFRRVGGTTDLSPDVRVIAATNRDLLEQATRGEFRTDLYYRLAVLHLHVPPLRERVGDVELLTGWFVDSFSLEFHKAVKEVTSGALRMLVAHGWPGNVRELKNAVERAVLLAEGPSLDVKDFDFLHAKQGPVTTFSLPAGGIDLRALERGLVIQALERAGGSPTRAAALLGLNRDQVRYRIAKFRLGR
jgi:DNA-binding NtrC family response regulator